MAGFMNEPIMAMNKGPLYWKTHYVTDKMTVIVKVLLKTSDDSDYESSFGNQWLYN